MFPTVGACKAVSVDGAKKVVAAWPGRVREIGCIRDGCGPTCEGNESDHCCGMAVDFMCSDAGGVNPYFLPLPFLSPEGYLVKVVRD